MAANIFGRYVWLVDTLRRRGRLTFEEINGMWQRSGLSYGEGDELAIRTFHNHRAAILDVFQVDIQCDAKDGYRYFIANPERLEGDALRGWLIDSYAVMNQVQADRRLEGRILFEDVPSGHEWLTAIAEAIRGRRVLEVEHQGFWRSGPSRFEIEPYYLKVARRRWYVVARSPYYSDRNRRKNAADGGDRPEDVFLVYALDRIRDLAATERTFEFDEGFSVERFFRGCCGVIPADGEPVRMVVKAYGRGADYLRTLPLHESQRELAGGVFSTEESAGRRSEQADCEAGRTVDDEAVFFEYSVCPNYDLYQTLLAQGEQIEVVGPVEVREEMRRIANTLAKYYKE